MNPLEKRATFSLATLFSLRMMGLFMILPVFTPYAHQLIGQTPFLIGMALGIYGLAQALLQLPFGTLSDHFNRKHIIALGFVLFITGSIIAASSDTIYGVILGRILQGAGAVGSTIIALLSDLTDESNRSKAMMIIGIIIGSSFFLAMLISPLLNPLIGVDGIFWLTAGFGCIAILLLYVYVPNPTKALITKPKGSLSSRMHRLLKDKTLISLNAGIFFLQVILTASFVVIPLFVHHTWIYVASLTVAIIFTFRLMRFYYLAIFGLILSEIALGLFHANTLSLGIGLCLFFIAFNVLEANLPSLVSKLAPQEMKGSAIGIFSSSQYLGMFIGGLFGGFLYGHTTPATVLFSCAIIATFWLSLALFLQGRAFPKQ